MKPCILIALITLTTLAEDAKVKLVLTDGTTYESVKVTRVEPDGLRIMHSAGATKIPFEKLTEETRRLYPFDADKAEAFRKEQGKAQAMSDASSNAAAQKVAAKEQAAKANAEKLKNALLVYSHAHQVGEKSDILVECFRPAGIYANPNPENRQTIYSGFILITGHPDIAKIADNDPVNCLVYPTGQTRKIGSSTYREYEFINRHN
jgi:hypothetical protein